MTRSGAKAKGDEVLTKRITLLLTAKEFEKLNKIAEKYGALRPLDISEVLRMALGTAYPDDFTKPSIKLPA